MKIKTEVEGVGVMHIGFKCPRCKYIYKQSKEDIKLNPSYRIRLALKKHKELNITNLAKILNRSRPSIYAQIKKMKDIKIRKLKTKGASVMVSLKGKK